MQEWLVTGYQRSNNLRGDSWAGHDRRVSQGRYEHDQARRAGPPRGPGRARNGSCSGTLTTASCTDTDTALTVGTTYSYEVKAALNNWVSAPGASFSSATSASLSAPSSANSFTITAGSAAQISATSGGGQCAVKAAAFTSPLVATVTDANGNPVSGASVASSGQATSSAFTAAGTIGSYTITATASGVTGSASFTETNTRVSIVSATTANGSGTVGKIDARSARPGPAAAPAPSRPPVPPPSPPAPPAATTC